MSESSGKTSASPLERCLATALVCALLVPQAALAGPSEMTVLEGEIDPLVSDGTLHEVTTQTQRSRAGFDTLDLEHDEILRVNQPNRKSKFFAEDWSGNETSIDGTVESNGLVGIINP